MARILSLNPGETPGQGSLGLLSLGNCAAVLLCSRPALWQQKWDSLQREDGGSVWQCVSAMALVSTLQVLCVHIMFALFSGHDNYDFKLQLSIFFRKRVTLQIWNTKIVTHFTCLWDGHFQNKYIFSILLCIPSEWTHGVAWSWLAVTWSPMGFNSLWAPRSLRAFTCLWSSMQ